MTDIAGTASRASYQEQAVALRIELLGGFRVSVGPQTIEPERWRLRKAATLVKLLALADAHRLHREQLLDILWPELDLKAAANNLHHALHVARRVLDLPPAIAPDYLRLQADQLTLCPPDAVWIDVEAFETAAVSARHSGEPDAYRAAIALYSGELLPEDRYEEWVADRREGLHRLYLALLTELAAGYENMGAFGPAIETLQRAVRAEPAGEEAHAGLMRLFARIGQRQQALRQYEQVCQVLRAELEVEPEDGTQQLHQAILAGEIPVSAASDRHHATAERRRRHNLPAALTSFIGRERELTEVKRLLQTSRLLTITGAGGAGKTRLALQVTGELVESYRGGVWLVELASISDPSLVPRVVAGALEIPEQPEEPVIATLIEALRSRQLLLVLDNCEQLVDACARLAQNLLQSCPELQILTTSREPLGVPGEVTGLVPPLSFPDPEYLPPMKELIGCEAVRLFVERARYRQPDFALSPGNAYAIAHICRQVEGIPLALELAAARVGVLSVDQIATRLQDALGLLTVSSRTAQPRQQTLRSAIDWSYSLLKPLERALFNRLSVFAGGWTLEAAESVGTEQGRRAADVLDLLSRLVDKSLVVAEAGADGGARYRLLEPIRQYACERLLESGENEEIRRRHAAWCLTFASEARPKLNGPQQVVWLNRLETEHDNLRAALEWYRSDRESAPMGLRLVAGLWWFWYVRGHLGEGRRWLETMLAATPDEVTADRAEALHGAGALARVQKDYDQATALLEEALQICRQLGDPAGTGGCLNTLGALALNQADFTRAAVLLEESLKLQRTSGETWRLAMTLNNLGVLAYLQHDLERSGKLYEESLLLARQIGSLRQSALAQANLGYITLLQDRIQQAAVLLAEGLVLSRRLGDKAQMAMCLEGLAGVAVSEGRAERGARLYGAAERLRRTIGVPLYAGQVADVDRFRREAQHALSGEAYEAACAAGQTLSLDQAVKYALGEQQPAQWTDTVRSTPRILTQREQEIVALIARGLTNRQIAAELHIADRTVDTHVGNILSKLELTSRTQVAAWVSAL